jgi:hypothetical protein
MKYSEIKDDTYYRRGRDYPYYSNRKQPNTRNVKMDLAMSGKEVKEWFTEEELKDYPKPNAYAGSLP